MQQKKNKNSGKVVAGLTHRPASSEAAGDRKGQSDSDGSSSPVSKVDGVGDEESSVAAARAR